MAAIKLTGAVDGTAVHVVRGVGLVTSYKDVAIDPKTGQPTGPGQLIMGESVVVFFGGGVQPMRVKGAPQDVANQLDGEPIIG